MKEITLYGAGGHCYAVVELIRSLGEYNPIMILDDAPEISKILGVPVLTSEDKLIQDNLSVTIGDNSIRKQIALASTANYPVFVHNSVVKYPSVEIKEGTVVLPNVVIDAAAKIGKHCILNNNATISHNVAIGDFCHIAIQAAIAGNVTIGEGVLVGAGSIVLPEISIGKWAIIGAGAVVTKDVPDYAIIMGNPGRVVRFNTPES